MDKILPFLTMRKRYLAATTILILVLLISFFLLRKPQEDAQYTVKREDVINNVLVNGTYMTAAQVQVMSPAKGIITKIYIANKDSVEKGKPLFYVESTATDEEKAKSSTEYKAALSALNTAKNSQKSLDATMWTKQQAYIAAQNTQDYKNNHTTNPSTSREYTSLEKLAIDNAVTQTKKDFDAAEQEYKTANVSVSVAQSKETSAKLAYDATQSILINAPVGGTVVNFQKKIGDEITNTTSPVLMIADFNNPIIIASVNEVNIPKLRQGQQATITFDSLLDKSFRGVVESIDDVGVKQQGAVTYNVSIALHGSDLDIKPNMTASIIIETGRKENVLTVPNAAIIKRDKKFYVQKVGNDASNLTEITLGLKGLTKTEVVSGLSEGEQVVIQE